MELTEKQKWDIYVAKLKIADKGIDAYQTNLSKTDCKLVEKPKKIFFVKYTSRKWEITPEFAKQIINIDALKAFKKIFEDNKHGFEQKVGKEQYDLLYNSIYYALSAYNLKLDEKQYEDDISRLVDICDNKVELIPNYYGKKFILNSLFDEEINYLKVLLKYNTQKIANYQSQHLSTTQIEKANEEMDK